jgi:hypothetical protein
MANSAYQRDLPRLGDRGRGGGKLGLRGGLRHRRRRLDLLRLNGRWCHRWRRSRRRLHLLRLNLGGSHGRGRVGLLRANSGGQDSVVLRADRAAMERVELLASLLFAFSNERAKGVAGVLHTKKCILAHGVMQEFGLGEEASLFGKQLGDGQCAGVGFGCCGIAVIDGAIGIEHTLISGTGALRLRTVFECLAQMLRLLIRGWPGDLASLRRQRTKEDQRGSGARLPSRGHPASRAERTEQTRGMEHSFGADPKPARQS